MEHFDLIILFFILGIIASWIKSDLEIPDQISKALSIFLLLSIGIKGGHEVRIAESLSGLLPSLLLGLTSCLALAGLYFFLFKNRLGTVNASALAACYGSVSAVTFVTAKTILENEGIPTNGYMIAVMAIMEIPAIILGVYFYRKYHTTPNVGLKNKWAVFTNKSVVLLLGGFIIGLLLNDHSWRGISPVVQGGFKGILALFLLDIGILAQKQMRSAFRTKTVAFVAAFIIPLIIGTLALTVGHFLGLQSGDKILLAVLVGSASYIAAPATIKSTMPDANPSLYMALPLGLTFPMNLIFGIPYYISLNRYLIPN